MEMNGNEWKSMERNQNQDSAEECWGQNLTEKHRLGLCFTFCGPGKWFGTCFGTFGNFFFRPRTKISTKIRPKSGPSAGLTSARLTGRLGPSRLGPSRLGPSRLGPRRLGPNRLGPALSLALTYPPGKVVTGLGRNLY